MMPLPTQVSASKYDPVFGKYNFDEAKPPKSFKVLRKEQSSPYNPDSDQVLVALRARECSCSRNGCNTLSKHKFVTLPNVSIGHDKKEIEMSIPEQFAQYVKYLDKPKESPATQCLIPVIFTPTCHHPKTARLNYFHIMPSPAEYIHILLVRPDEFLTYVNFWGGSHAIVKLPKTMPDVEETVYNGGVGYARRFAQWFAKRLNIPGFFMADDNIFYFSQTKTDKDGIKLKRHGENKLKYDIIPLSEFTNVVQKLGNEKESLPQGWENEKPFTPHANVSDKNTFAAYNGPLNTYGIIGMLKERGVTANNFKHPFQKRHVHSFVFINNDQLMEKNILYQPWPVHEDCYLNNQVDTDGLHVLKMYAFKMRKVCLPDTAFMYSWRKGDKISSVGRPNIEVPFQKVATLAREYFKTLRISKDPDISEQEHIPESEPSLKRLSGYLKEMKKHKTGTPVFLAVKPLEEAVHDLISLLDRPVLFQRDLRIVGKIS